jgi:hypothetical protein
VMIYVKKKEKFVSYVTDVVRRKLIRLEYRNIFVKMGGLSQKITETQTSSYSKAAL